MIPKIAVIGAGLAGLGLSYFLSKTSKVTLFDPQGIGGGASGIAAGLLHPFVGQSGHLNPFGWEGMEATLALIHELNLPRKSGILRLPLNDRMEKRLASYPEFLFLNEEETKSRFPPLSKTSSLWLEKGYTVDTPIYLQGLMAKVESSGGLLIKERVDDLSTLKSFDKIILCIGGDSPSSAIRRVKGHLLEVEWPDNLPYLTTSVSGEGYLIAKRETCLIGSTYERDFTSDARDPEKALSELLPRADRMVKGLKDAKVLKVLAGVRASTSDHLPLIEKIDHKTYLFSGLGSRGLLYHALYAKKLLTLL